MLKLRFPLPVFRNAREIANGRNARMALKGLVANRAALIISPSFGSSQYFEQVVRLINAQSVRVIEPLLARRTKCRGTFWSYWRA